MGYVFVPTIISAGFTYTISGNTVSFTDTTGITGGNLTGWSWSFPGGNPSSSALQNPSVTYSASGTYTVCLIATSAAGCKDTSCQSIFIPPSSVAGNNALSFLTLSPVPVSNELFLDFGINNFGEVKISFCNVLGKEIFSKIIPAKEKQMLDVSDFQTGIYFVKIQTDAGDAVKKIIISR
jgi:PKD repeat protein